MKRINCRKCINFYVTWDQSNPYGCRYFGFKTKMLPSVYVYKSSGEPCKAFKTKDNDPEDPKKPKLPKYV